MATLSTSGIVNNLTTILSIVAKLAPEVAVIPQVISLFEAAISTFSHEDKATAKSAYEAKMLAADEAHKETQAELAQDAGETTMDISGTDASPKGGGL